MDRSKNGGWAHQPIVYFIVVGGKKNKKKQILFIASRVKPANKARIIRTFKVSFGHFYVLIMRVIRYYVLTILISQFSKN